LDFLTALLLLEPEVLQAEVGELHALGRAAKGYLGIASSSDWKEELKDRGASAHHQTRSV
jgi:hypothetical protein